MTYISRLRWIVLVLITAVLVACGGDGAEVNFSTANIQDPVLAKDEAGNEPATVFNPEDTVYVLADLKNAPPDTTVRAVFTAVDVAGEAANTKIDEVEVTGSGGPLVFNLSPANPWPGGDYQVELYLDGELDQTLSYKVENPDAEQSEAEETEPEATEMVEEEEATATPDKVEETAVDPPAAGAVTTVEAARSAVIQIQAEGTFVEPEGVALNAAGRGSGFIIDSSGIAVTNNHVVTGAALVKVWLDGEEAPRNARIIASSECSDLAVIDIDGDGFPYLEWHGGDAQVGNEVYVAGFPLGDPEYTLTRGIVSKENANGESTWASVDHVIEYDAQAIGGNSGSPVINNQGQVIAVHYASSAVAEDQAFGIGADIAQDVVAQLRRGQDVNAIGINGRAIANEDGSIFGVWVSSVKSGSPADQAGIRPGDLLRQLEGLVLATDGTMADYCDILRSREADDTMSFALWRLDTGEVLEGQINGRVAEVVDTFGNTAESAGSESAAGTGGSNEAGYANYVTINDDSGQLAVSVPAAWSQVDGSAWTNGDGETLGVSIVAAPDLNGLANTWATPGVSFKASSELGMTDTEVLDLFDFSSECEYSGREAYSDALYSGQYDVWANCGSGNATYVVLTAVPEGGSFVILLEVQLVSEADMEAYQNILNSFIVQ
jgi:serine protease Do